MSKVYKSKEQTMCPVPDCKTTVRKDRLKDHLQTIHKISSYVPPQQKSITTFFLPSAVPPIGFQGHPPQQPQPPPTPQPEADTPVTPTTATPSAASNTTTTPTTSAIEVSEERIDEIISETQEEPNADSSPVASTSTALLSRSEGKDPGSDATKPSFFSKIRSSLKRRRVNNSKDSLNINSNLNDKLDVMHETLVEVNDNVKALSRAVSKLNILKSANQGSDAVKRKKIESAKKLLLRASKSIQELINYAPEFITVESENCLHCQVCINSNSTTNFGKFRYDFSLGSDFARSTAPREFINLKTMLVKHLESKGHIKLSKETELASTKSVEWVARNYKVGMVLGIEAYKILKTSDSYLRYETDVSVLTAQGLDVGNINHSRRFCSEFAISVKEVLQSRLHRLLDEPLPATGRPVPIAVIADKLTPNRRTMQIVGFHGYVGNHLQSLVAGVPPLSGNDGISVAQCIRTGLGSLKIPIDDMHKRLVGGAFDGEYFNLNIPHHLMNMMLISDECRQWFSFIWDIAHILELAEKDSRKGKNSNAMSTVISVISKISQSFSHGKSFKELLQEAEIDETLGEDEDEVLTSESEKEKANKKANKKARVPGHFSDTRFATYSDTVIRKWLHNYEYYYRILERRQDDDLDKMNHAHFIFLCGALADVYSVLGKLSNAMQKPGVPQWEVCSIINTYMSTLERMEKEVTQEGESTESELFEEKILNYRFFPTLGAILKEVTEKNSFQNCPILIKQHTVHSTRGQQTQSQYVNTDYTASLISSTKAVKVFISKFRENFSFRLDSEKTRNPIIHLMGQVFDISEITKRESFPPEVEESLNKYFDLAQSVGCIEPGVEFIKIKTQYALFCERAKSISEDFKYDSGAPPSQKKQSNFHPAPVHVQYPERYEQVKLYEKFLNSSVLYKDIPDILHLALAAITRTHCEAVVEGMGSVLGFHSQNRNNLDPKTVETETIIRWQGPHPSICKPLVIAALDHHFKGRDKWHFCVTWDKAKHFARSQVLNRIDKHAKESNKIPFE